MEELNPEERAEVQRLFREAGDGGGRVCSFCGGIHTRACPRVREFELFENGGIKRVAFWGAGDWSDDYIIWPEMAFEGAAETETETVSGEEDGSGAE